MGVPGLRFFMEGPRPQIFGGSQVSDFSEGGSQVSDFFGGSQVSDFGGGVPGLSKGKNF